MLNDEEMDALDQYRKDAATDYQVEVLATAMLRLYPPGWDEPVTPERLVEAGFKFDEFQRWYVSPNDMLWWTPANKWTPAHWRVGGAYVVAECEPRNMKEARELLERCGALQ
jgi:hypothetical protein